MAPRRKYTPEEAEERRKERVRIAGAKYREGLKDKTRAEKAAFMERHILGDEFDPYTPEERLEVERLGVLAAELAAGAESLNGRLVERLRGEIAANPNLEPILKELETGRNVSVLHKPY